MRTLCTIVGAYALTLLAFFTLVAIAMECSRRVWAWRAVRELIRSSASVALPPHICAHSRETLDSSLYSKVALRCLDCGERRIVGDVWFGASNRKVKRPAA